MIKPALIAFGMLCLLAMQYRLWLGDGNFRQLRQMYVQRDQVQAGLAKLSLRNRALEAEIQDLRQKLDAVEERARTELGMIKSGEHYFEFGQRPQPKTEAG